MKNEMTVKMDFDAMFSVKNETAFSLAAAHAIAREMERFMIDWDFENEKIKAELNIYMPEGRDSEALTIYKISYSCRMCPENNSGDRDMKSQTDAICKSLEREIVHLGCKYGLRVSGTKLLRNDSDDWSFHDNGRLIIAA